MGTPAITVDELQGDQEHNADHGSGFIIDFGTLSSTVVRVPSRETSSL
jgi:hypothetical protein